MRFFIQLTLKAILLSFLFQPLTGFAYNFDGNTTDNLPIFETMTVIDHQHRFRFQINETEGLIELCGLNVGDQYSMILNIDEKFSRCILELSDAGEEKILIHYPSKNRINDRLRYFTADAECMQFKVSNLNCHPGQTYDAWASLLCESCEKKDKGLAAAIADAAPAPIAVGGGFSSVELIEDVFIAGGCFEVTNVIPIGDAAGRGTFSNGLTTVNMEDGVILACGDITNALGPNLGTGTSTSFGDTSGDPDLDILGGGVDIRDAVGIEFTVEPTIDQIEFQYAFASEEYCDYVGTQFNDVFGFFISGLGIAGGFSNGGANIAQIPGGGGPVAINSVNHLSNTQFFNPNANAGAAYCDAPAIAINDIEYDGFTTVLTAVANVVPCRQYTVRLVVADRSDHIFDSAVFLKGNSFEAGGQASLDFNVFFDETTGAAYEGCSDGELVFERLGFDTSEPVTLPITISPGSTAIEGLDYSFLPDSITIPAGETTVILPFTIFDDGITEGLENLTVYIENTCECGGSIIALNIQDNLPIDIVLQDDVLCGPQGIEVTPTVNGGIPEFTYEWSTGDFSEQLFTFIDQTTTYTVTVSDQCGNTAEQSTTIQVNQASFASVTGGGLICPENPGQPVFLQVDFVGPGPWEIGYSIDGAAQPPISNITQNPYMLQATQPGNYQLNSVFSQGCDGIAVGFATVNVEFLDVVPIVTELTCAGFFDGAIDLFPSGGTEPYSYEWDNSLFGPSLWGLDGGQYTVTVTDFYGCTNVQTVDVFAPEVLEATIDVVDSPTCADPDGGSIDLTIQGGRPFYTILWEDGSFQEDRSDLTIGTYYVTVFDFMGCTVIDSIVVDGVIDLPTPIAEVSGEINCNQTFATLSATNSSGTGTLAYQWFDSSGMLIATTENTDVNDLGSYTLVVTDQGNNCSAETTVNVAQNIAQPSPVAQSSGPLTCAQGEVTLDASLSTGIGTLSYEWSNPSNMVIGSTPDLMVNTPGTYTLLITDSENGCTAETTVNVNQDVSEPLPDAQADGTLTCIDGDVMLDASGSSGAATLNYEWFNGITPLGTSTTINVMTAGTYTLVVTNPDNGCTAETTVDVDQDVDLPIPDAQVSGDITCAVMNATLDASNSSGNGALDYQWLNGSTSVGTGSSVNVNDAGTYTLIITDQANGCTAQTTINVNENIAAPTPDAVASGQLTCEEDMITLDGGTSSGIGTLDYEWFDPGNGSLGGGTTVDVSTMGTYTLVITDQANGCTASTTVNVGQNINPPNIDAGSGATLTCGLSSVELNGAGNGSGVISYEWSNPGGIIVGTTASINATEAGTYTLVVTDAANGCTAEATTQVMLDENVPMIDLPLPNELTCNTMSVELNASNSSGNGNLTFNWLNSSNATIGTGATVNVSDAGTYTLIISDDSNGCTAEATVSVDQNVDAPDPAAQAIGILTCLDGTVELNAGGSSGEGALSYVWTNSSNMTVGSDESIDVTEPGDYTLIITDAANGCTAETSVTVDQNEDLPTPVALVSNQLTCSNEMAQLDAGNSSGIGTLDYNWLNPNNDPISNDEQVEITEPGTYTLQVTDPANGCTAETTIQVDQDITLPLAEAGNGGTLSCDVDFVSLDGGASSGGNGFTYEWFNPNDVMIGTTLDIDVTEAGTYTLVVTNTNNGCTQSDQVLVTPDVNLPSVNIINPISLTCAVETVQLDASGSTANGALSFNWLDENNGNAGSSDVISVTTPGNYTLVITDQNNGCTAEATIEVLQDIEAPDVDAAAQGDLTCLDQTTQLEALTAANLNHNWLNPNNVPIGNQPTVTVGEIGIYTLVVTNPQTGCTNSTQVEVFDNIDAPIPIAVASDIIDCSTPSVNISAAGSNGIGTLTYNWLNGNNQSIGTDLDLNIEFAGTYELVITDAANGCTASTTVEVFEDFAAPTADAGDNDVLSCQVPQVTLNGSASSGGNNFTYQWLNDQSGVVGTTVNVDVNEPGVYTLIVTNSTNGCTASDQIEISPDVGQPIPDAQVLNVINCSNADAMIDAGNSSGTGNLLFDWRNEAGMTIGSSTSINVAAAGNYTLIITDESNGCSAQTTVMVVEDFEDPVAQTSDDALLTCQITEVGLSGNGSSSGAPFVYQWLNPSNVEVGTSLDVMVTELGTYTLVVTNTTNGCTASSTVDVLPDVGLPTPMVAQSGILTCENLMVTLDGSASTGTGNLVYEWLDNNQMSLGTADQIDLENPGIYTLVVSDTNNGCTAEMTVEILEDIEAPTADAGMGATLTCAQDQYQLNGGGSSLGTDFTYQWLDGNAQELSTAIDPMITDAGTYTLVVTNTANGCTSSAAVTVDENFTDPQALIAAPQPITCATASVDLDASGSTGIDPLTYEWRDAGGAVLGNDPILSVDETGNYTLVVTDPANGCTASTQMMVQDDLQAPIADAGNGGVLTCSATSISLDGAASSLGNNFSYEWFNAGNVIVGTDLMVDVNEIGIYTLVVTNTTNGCTASATAEVTPDANLPTATAAVSDQLTCAVEMVTLDGSQSSSGAGITYEWVDPNNMTISNETNIDVDEPGTYTLVVTNTNNGCTSSFSVEVDQNIEAPIADAGTNSTITCQVPSVMLNASNSTGTGTLAYQWIGPTGINVGNTPMLEVENPGIYELIVTGENGCTHSSTVEVLLDAEVPVADTGLGGTLSCLQSLVSLGGPNTSTGNSISYEWFDENNILVGTTLTLEVDEPGIYTLVVNNSSNNCSSSSIVEVLQNIEPPVADVGTTNTLNCNLSEWTIGGANTSTGNNFTYQWQSSNGMTVGTDLELTVTDSDVYTLLVTNTENGCTTESSIEVFQNFDTPIADAGPSSVLTCATTSVNLDGSNSTQGASIVYEWFNESGVPIGTSASIEVNQSGTYTILVTNTASNCTATATVEVSPDANLPSVDIAPAAILTCTTQAIQLDGGNSSTINGDINYSWQNEMGLEVGTDVQLTVSDPGIYTLQITDPINGCSNSTTVEVVQDIEAPLADAGTEQVLTCSQTSVSLDASASSGNNLVYEWLDSDGMTIGNAISIDVSIVDVYTLVVTNTLNGCSSSATVAVTPDTNLPSADAGSDAILNCNIQEVSLSGVNSSSGPNIVYEWQDANGQIIGTDPTVPVTAPGTYTLFVINTTNNCSSQDVVVITENLQDPDPEIVPLAGVQIDCNNSSVVLNATVGQVGNNVSYLWTTAGGNIVSATDLSEVEVNAAGQYLIEVINLDNGCTAMAAIDINEDLANPIADIAPADEMNCNISEVQLNANNSSIGNNFAYQWQAPSSTSIVSGGDGLTPIVNQTGNYILTVINQDNGCAETTNVTVSGDFVAPQAEASVNDILDCVTASLNLFGNGSTTGPNINYQWSGVSILDGANGLNPLVDAPGNYTLVVTDQGNGCTAETMVTVSSNEDVPTLIDLVIDPPLCDGENGGAAVLSVVGGSGPYLFSTDSGANYFPDTALTQLAPGTYSIMVQDAIGCEHEQSFVVPETPALLVDTETEVTISLGESHEIQTEINIPNQLIDTIIWTPDVGLSCNNCLNPEASPFENTVYQITVINENGCISRDQVIFNVRKDRKVYIPNAFSPDGEGDNNLFLIYSDEISVVQVNSFQVYSRWGEMVYEANNFMTDDPAYGWDGTFRGQILNPGVYVFWAEVLFIDGTTEIFKGDVTLMR